MWILIMKSIWHLYNGNTVRREREREMKKQEIKIIRTYHLMAHIEVSHGLDQQQQLNFVHIELMIQIDFVLNFSLRNLNKNGNMQYNAIRKVSFVSSCLPPIWSFA